MPAPSEAPPFLLKTIAPLRHPADVMVLIDVDMVVTRPLTPLIERAAEGRVVVFKDNMDRFDPRWGPALDLGLARRRPYVSSGLVVLGGETGARGPSPLGRSPAPGGLRALLLRRGRARLPVPLPRPGHPQRGPQHPRRARARGHTRQAPRPHAAVPPAAGHRRGRAAVRLRRRHRALRHPPVRAQALARADVPRDLLAAAQPALAGAGRARETPGARGPAANAKRARRQARAPARRRARPRPLVRARRDPGVGAGAVASARERCAAHEPRRLLLRRRRALLPRPRRDAQLASPAGPSRARIRARRRAHARPARAARPARERRRGGPRDRAVAGEDARPDARPGRGDDPDRRRHDRHPLARRADRGGRRGPRDRLSQRPAAVRRAVGRAPRTGARRRRRPTSPPASWSSVAKPGPRCCACSTIASAGSTWTAPCSAATRPTTRSCIRSRTCSTRSSARGSIPTASTRSRTGSPPTPLSPACASPTRRRCAASTPTAPSPTCSTTSTASRGWRRCTTGSSRGCSRACCSGLTSPCGRPRTRCRCACAAGRSPASSGPGVDVVDVFRRYVLHRTGTAL